jgi:hypothetical protein
VIGIVGARGENHSVNGTASWAPEEEEVLFIGTQFSNLSTAVCVRLLLKYLLQT